VRLATAYLPEEMRNPEGWMRALEEAGEGKADIVCLGEMVHVLPGAPRFPYPIPGPATDVLADAARHHNTTIVASLAEADGALQYNTGVVIGRNGRIAGRYRKTHLPQAEVEVGTTPGNTFPVFDTDIGRVGIQICYDHFFPEVSRMLALQGAEIIFTPIMGDVRTDMQAYEAVARARAIDNSVYYVTSIRDTGRSLIVDPSGTILADSNNEPGVVFADVDLDQEYWEPWLSVEGFGEFRRLWPKERRPERYAALLKRR
jgi:predicted amidohydrolase